MTQHDDVQAIIGQLRDLLSSRADGQKIDVVLNQQVASPIRELAVAFGRVADAIDSLAEAVREKNSDSPKSDASL